MTDHPLVDVSLADGVATLRLDRPDKRNALDAALMRSIAAAFDAIRDDPAVRVVVLRGNGPTFSSGIDHGFLLEVFQKSQGVPFRHLHHDIQEVFHRIERMEKPVIAALHRTCVGMALELALACDLRLATADCALGLPEIAFGIVPDVGGTTRLVRTVGYQQAKVLILTGKILSAASAARIGLLDEVATDAADLDARLGRLCARLAALSPVALGKAKTLVRQSAELDAAASFQLEGLVQEVLMRQPDLHERFPAALRLIREGIERPE